jgi:hypothetical protein
MSARHARKWTLTRRLADRWFPHVFPGQRHMIWGQP